MTKNRHISSLFSGERPLRSLEFFPPKNDAGIAALQATAEALQPVDWDFVSVTYGAGGSTRETTSRVSHLLKDELHFTVMPHLTCVGHSRDELLATAERLYTTGFRNIMTLRGDPPRETENFTPALDGLRHASELVSLLKDHHPDFCLGVAGYPEKHPEAASLDTDLDHLKHKVDCGADFITTQLFFDNRHYYDFVERCRARNITVPIVPGIMPVLSLPQIKRITQLSSATLPDRLLRRLEAAADHPEVVEIIGVDWALDQIRDLLAHDAPGYHLYVLNRARPALALAAGLAA